MDESHFEHAALLELAARDKALHAAREHERKAHARPADFDGTCPECGNLIDAGRIDAGYFVCIKCKEQEERQRKQFFQ